MCWFEEGNEEFDNMTGGLANAIFGSGVSIAAFSEGEIIRKVQQVIIHKNIINHLITELCRAHK